jgi:hypothetical protein
MKKAQVQPNTQISNIVYHIKHKNMINHYNNLKIIDIDNEELKTNISKLELEMNSIKSENEKNIQLPSEIKKHIDNKPWIRIPYPIREIKLVAYIEEKKMSKEIKDTYLKLLYEKKLTSKVVEYNQSNGKIENITIELPGSTP